MTEAMIHAWARGVCTLQSSSLSYQSSVALKKTKKLHVMPVHSDVHNFWFYNMYHCTQYSICWMGDVDITDYISWDWQSILLSFLPTALGDCPGRSELVRMTSVHKVQLALSHCLSRAYNRGRGHAPCNDQQNMLNLDSVHCVHQVNNSGNNITV